MSKTERDNIILGIKKQTERVNETTKEYYWDQLKLSVVNPCRIRFEEVIKLIEAEENYEGK